MFRATATVPTVVPRLFRCSVTVPLIATALGIAVAAGQPMLIAQTARSGDARIERLHTWREAVEAHEAGRRDRPLLDLMTWSEGDLTTVVSDAAQLSRLLARANSRLRQTGRPSTVSFGRRTLAMAEVQELLGLPEEEARRGDANRLALRGALLHTDIATLIGDRNRAWPSPAASSPRAAIMVRDGQHHGSMDTGVHWELGRDLLDLLADEPRAEEVVRRWYVATSAFLQSRSLLSDLEPHITRALQRFPDDPHLLFYLQRARQAFDRALAADPHLLEARLRLGRTLLTIGRHEQAVSQLRRVLDGPASQVVEYYAAIFLGETEVVLGRTDSAWQSFERAAGLYPSAQSPRLAMSRLAQLTGRHEEALAALMQMLASDPDDPARLDPWWKYFSAREDEADELVSAWRTGVDRWE